MVRSLRDGCLVFGSAGANRLAIDSAISERENMAGIPGWEGRFFRFIAGHTPTLRIRCGDPTIERHTRGAHVQNSEA